MKRPSYTKERNEIEILRFFILFFKNVKNGRNVESEKNRRKSRALFYTYINAKKRRNIIVP